MKNKIPLLIFLILCIIIASSIIFILNKNNSKEKESEKNQTIEELNNTNIVNVSDTNIESENQMNINVIIDEISYNVKLEYNETVKSFLNMLPQEYNMEELNGNEKFIYLDETLPTSTYTPKHIEAGDIMLYGNNCLVLFYKSFNTSYSYTKIGHIDNLPDLGKEDIKVKYEIKN